MNQAWPDTAEAPATQFDLPPQREPSNALAGRGIGQLVWRRQALLLVAILASFAVFLLARSMANHPHLAADWRQTADGHLELADTALSVLKPHVGKTLAAVILPDGTEHSFDALTFTHSARWIASDETRQAQVQARLQVAHALEAGRIGLRFADGETQQVPASPRGYAALGSMFWLLSAFAVLLMLVGCIVPLVRAEPRNLLYLVMAVTQAGQLALAAVAAVPGLTLPSSMVVSEFTLHMLLDALTGAAVVHATCLHPVAFQRGRLIAGGAWLVSVIFSALICLHQLPHAWWWGQGLLLADGLICIALLSWVLRRRSHPFATVMRRLAIVTVLTLCLLTLAVALMPLMPAGVRPAATVGPVLWGVFLASMILLVPFASRSQNAMREFAMLAGVSTVATSIDLLFVAVFSFSQFASLALSLFLALGAYAALRQWLLNQMIGARNLTTERMFRHLYRIAREVEARPERAAERMVELLQSVFEPMEAVLSSGQASQSRVASNGALLLVPLPNLVGLPCLDGLVVLRYAEHGKRLFNQDDARLADRILEQLMRALAHDRAVERGRSEERTRIAQDLHDDIGARLLTLMYKAPSKEMEDYVRHTLQDLKTLTRGLAAKNHPLSLACAEWKTDITLRLEAVHCTLEWSACLDQELTLSVVQWSSLTRILRELVSNVISHAQATEVRIGVELNAGEFRINVTDNGIGRAPKTWAHGLGLGGIRKRVKLLGGQVSWQERSEVGIHCSVVIPQLTQTGD